MTLKQQLTELKETLKAQIPAEVFDRFEKSVDDLRDVGAGIGAPTVGDQLPEFALTNQAGQRRSLSEFRRRGPVVLVFYRGGWCPYCNLELQSYQRIVPQLHEAVATLVAITPESPDSSLSTLEKNELEFEVLTDFGAEYAKEIGIAFSLSDDLRELYANFGADLNQFNGEGNWDLPIPATFVVGTDGKIVFAHVDADYTTRANTEEVLNVVQNLIKIKV